MRISKQADVLIPLARTFHLKYELAGVLSAFLTFHFILINLSLLAKPSNWRRYFGKVTFIMTINKI